MCPYFPAFGLDTERYVVWSIHGDMEYSFRMRENTDQNNSVHGHVLHSVIHHY